MLRFNTLIWGIVLLGIIAVAYFYTQESDKKVDPAIQTVVDKYRTPDGRFLDRMNDLKIASKEDVRFSRKDGIIQLKYGEMVFEIKEKDVSVESLRKNLQLLGVDIIFTKDDRVIVKYKGEVVKEVE